MSRGGGVSAHTRKGEGKLVYTHDVHTTMWGLCVHEHVTGGKGAS